MIPDQLSLYNSARFSIRRFLLCTLLLIGCSSYGQINKGIKINWVPAIHADYSFTHKWSYPEGVAKNEFGQLICDGFCPPETDAMVDSDGKIRKDSLAAYYKIVDTSHQTYSIQCKAWCYEWAGTDFIEAIQKTTDTVYCYTLMNAATHCSLQLTMAGDQCFALIDLKSIASGGSAVYRCLTGNITIDKTLWKNGILKATFSFNFEHTENPQKPMYWRGKIFTKIKGI